MNWRNGFHSIFAREMRLAFAHKQEIINPLAFFVLVVVLFPIAVGPGEGTLSKIGPGIVWVAALLSSMLALERMFKDDFLDGWLEQELISSMPLNIIVLAKVLSHWVLTGLPLILMTPLLALFLNIESEGLIALIITLSLGTPFLSLVGAIGVALTVGLRKGGVLLSLLLLPLYIPLLIFSTSAIETARMNLPYSGQISILAALLLLALTLTPFATSSALKVSNN